MLSAACSLLPTSPETVYGPSDPLQQYVEQQAFHYADMVNISIKVSFMPQSACPLTGPILNPVTQRAEWFPAAGWVGCGDTKPPYVIHFNKDDLEKTGPAYYDAVAAHEVCHLYYGDNKEACGYTRDDKIETRATICGDALQHGIVLGR